MSWNTISVYSAHRQYVTIMIKADHTCVDDAIKALDKPYNAHTDFILKVVGPEEYICDSTKVIDFEAVHIAVRNENDVEFVSIKAAKEKQEEYEEKFKTAYQEEVRMRDFLEFEDMTSKELPRVEGQKEFEPVAMVSLYDCNKMALSIKYRRINKCNKFTTF